MRQPSINHQPQALAASIATNGVGGIGSPQYRQQGVDVSQNTSGWTFVTDGSDGLLQLALSSAPADAASGASSMVCVSQAATGAGALLLSRATALASGVVRVLVTAVDGTTPVNLGTTAVVVAVVGIPT